MINSTRDPIKEIARIFAEMSPEKRSEVCNEMFKYDSGNPVPCTEGKIPPNAVSRHVF